jgi:hypothetical protein
MKTTDRFPQRLIHRFSLPRSDSYLGFDNAPLNTETTLNSHRSISRFCHEGESYVT